MTRVHRNHQKGRRELRPRSSGRKLAPRGASSGLGNGAGGRGASGGKKMASQPRTPKISSTFALSAARARFLVDRARNSVRERRRTSTGHFPRLFQPDSALAEAIRPRGSVSGTTTGRSLDFSLPSKFARLQIQLGRLPWELALWRSSLGESSEVPWQMGNLPRKTSERDLQQRQTPLKSSEAVEQERGGSEDCRGTFPSQALAKAPLPTARRGAPAEKRLFRPRFFRAPTRLEVFRKLLAPAQVGRKTSDLDSSGTELPQKSSCLDFRKSRFPGKSAEEDPRLLQNLRKTSTTDFPPAPTARKTSNEHLAQRHLARKSSRKGGAPLQLLRKRSVPASA